MFFSLSSRGPASLLSVRATFFSLLSAPLPRPSARDRHFSSSPHALPAWERCMPSQHLTPPSPTPYLPTPPHPPLLHNSAYLCTLPTAQQQHLLQHSLASFTSFKPVKFGSATPQSTIHPLRCQLELPCSMSSCPVASIPSSPVRMTLVPLPQPRRLRSGFPLRALSFPPQPEKNTCHSSTRLARLI